MRHPSAAAAGGAIVLAAVFGMGACDPDTSAGLDAGADASSNPGSGGGPGGDASQTGGARAGAGGGFVPIDGGGPKDTCPKHDYIKMGPGTACHTLPQLAPAAPVVPTIRQGQASEPAGGAIRDGFYVLTEIEVFGGSIDIPARRLTVASLEQGKYLLWTLDLMQTTTAATKTAIVGTDLNLSHLCADGVQIQSNRFTATEDALVLYGQQNAITTVSTYRRLSCD